MSLRYAQIFDGGTLTASPPPDDGGGGVDGFPSVKEIHKFEAHIPSGSLTHDTSIGKSIDLEKTWAIVHTRTESQLADDTMVGYTFPNNSTIRLSRHGAVGRIDATVQLVEFNEGVRVQRGEFHTPVGWNDHEVPIAQVDLDKTFLTLKIAAENDEFSGFDIVGEMWVRGKFKDNETLIFDHNENTIGDSPEPVSVYWQVVEFADGARVWSRDVNGIDISDNYKTADILDDLGLDRPPRPDQSFIVFSNRMQADSSGSSPRVDFWSMDGFLFNGSAGLWRSGGDEGEKKDTHIFIVELEFVYIEPYNITSPTSDPEQQIIEQSLGAIRDGNNTVAFIPWNQWGGFVDEGSDDSGKFWCTVDVLDENTLQIIREDGSAPILSMEVYVMEFAEPPLTADLGPLVIKEIYSGDTQFVRNIFGVKPTQRDISLPAAVDQEKSIVWVTAAGQDSFDDAMAWAEFVDDSTIRVHCPGDDDFTDMTWYVWEFESGVKVQRGKFQSADFSNNHASEVIDTVDVNRAFVIAQWGERSPHGAAWLGGARQIRGFVPGGVINDTPVAWQVVEISNDGEVHHFGKGWQSGDGKLVEELGIGADWDLDSLFVWASDFHAESGRLQHYNVQGEEQKVIVTRGNDGGRGSSVIEVVDLGTFETLIPQQEHHFVSIDVFTDETFDLALDNEYDINKTLAWIPMVGNFLVPIAERLNEPGGSGGAARLKMIDSTTLRMFFEHTNAAFVDSGDKWEGVVYVLGFIPEEEGPCPPTECPEGIEVVTGPCESGIEITESPCPEGVVAVFRKDGGIEICPRGG